MSDKPDASAEEAFKQRHAMQATVIVLQDAREAVQRLPHSDHRDRIMANLDDGQYTRAQDLAADIAALEPEQPTEPIVAG